MFTIGFLVGDNGVFVYNQLSYILIRVRQVEQVCSIRPISLESVEWAVSRMECASLNRIGIEVDMLYV